MGNTIKGLLPDGRLPSAAEAHVRSIIEALGPDLAMEVSGTVVLDADGPRIQEFYTVGTTVIGGETFPVDSALVVRRKVDGSWERWVAGVDTTWLLFDVGGGSENPEEPVDAPPIPGTITASNVAATQLTLTADDFAADAGFPSTPFSFSVDGGATWSTWQSSPQWTAQMLDPDTDHVCQHRVRDTQGQIVGGAPITVHTLYLEELWADALAADAPTHWWKLDEPVGAVSYTDSGSSPASGTIVGAPEFGGPSLGGSPGSARFSTDSYLDTGAMDFAALTSGTVEVLVDPVEDLEVDWWRASGYSRGVVRRGVGGSVSTGKATFTVAGGTGLASPGPGDTLGTGTIHLVFAISSAGSIAAYRNGVLIDTTQRSDPSAPFSPATEAIRIGLPTSGGGEVVLSDVAVYNGVQLSEERVRAHARAAGVLV